MQINKLNTTRTPFYYYDTNLLEATLNTINKETERYEIPMKVHYAVKANANQKILECIRKKGLGVDCVSGGEIEAAIKAGFSPSSIVFAGVGKADWEIELGLNIGIFCFNVESIPELEVINELAAQKNKIASVALRINPNVVANTHKNIRTGHKENKFGINFEQLDEVFTIAQKLDHINIIGLHFHIGSQLLVMDDFIALCKRINELQDDLETKGIQLSEINVGGGLGIDYQSPDENPIPDFESYFATYNEHLKLRKGQQLHFELGRSIVGQCGSLITKVLYVKSGSYKDFVIVDAGMSDLLRPALYQAYHRIENITSSATEEAKYDVVGPICESSDVFDKDINLPVTKRGDYLALRSAGAYGEIMASVYNCRELPKGYTKDELK